jgi:protein-disulfide isomerase
MFARFALPVLLLLGAPASALELDNMTDAEREQFRQEVRAYLLENPEVLQEAIAVLQTREQEAQAANDAALAQANMDALFDDGHSFVGGNPDGDVTLVEFVDYRCGFCKRAFPEVSQLVSDDPNIRYVIKEFPILGEQSVLASRYAIATHLVAGDAVYEDVHNALMTFRGDITPVSLERLGDTFGLDNSAITTAMKSEEVEAVITKNRELAQKLQISGTPTFVFQNQMVRGYVPLAEMETLIAEAREE